MSAKTYVLLPHINSGAASNVYLQVNPNQRIKYNKRKNEAAFLKIAFTDKEGKSKIIRYKRGCDVIDFYKQIKEKDIPANEKFNHKEYEAVRFVNEMLTTKDETLQEFLETSPQFDQFWVKDKDGKVGSCEELRGPLYTLLNEEKAAKEEKDEWKRRLKAANKIEVLNLKGAQDLLIQINGSFFEPPANLDACQNMLIAILDDASDEVMNMIVGDQKTIDDEMTILIARSLEGKHISFEAEPNWVSRIIDGKPVRVKEISSEYSAEERKRYFAEFLISKEGKLLKADLEKLINTKT